MYKSPVPSIITIIHIAHRRNNTVWQKFQIENTNGDVLAKAIHYGAKLIDTHNINKSTSHREM